MVFHGDYPRFAGSFTAALPHGQRSHIVIGIGIKALFTGFGGKPGLGVPVGFTVIQSTHAHVQRALIEFDLNGVLANVVSVRLVSESMRINAPPR